MQDGRAATANIMVGNKEGGYEHETYKDLLDAHGRSGPGIVRPGHRRRSIRLGYPGRIGNLGYACDRGREEQQPDNRVQPVLSTANGLPRNWWKTAH